MSELREILALLLEHQWLYRFPVTEVLVRGVLDEFPDGWAEALEPLTTSQLNDLVVGELVDDSWPLSLIHFVRSCRKIRGTLSADRFVLNSEARRYILKPPRELMLGLNEKKQHEAFHLAHFAHEVCSREGLRVIVDLGAGLGYICQILHHLFNYKVLGLESNPSIARTARERQTTLHPLAKSAVQYSCLKVTENSAREIENLVKSLADESEGVCLLGLHSCGDLSTNALKLFRDMRNAKTLIMMSCCYHKLEFSDDEKCFKNFPMSRRLREECERVETSRGGTSNIRAGPKDVREVLGRPFLRLACQEPAERWLDLSQEAHDQHALCMMARAVLELYAHQNKMTLQKTKRKSARASQCTNFESYLRDFALRYAVDGRQMGEDDFQEVQTIWDDNKHKLRRSEVYTGLQLLLQSSAEFLVLSDRRCWLEEQGFQDVRIVAVLDRSISPRSHAIVSTKR